MAKPKVTHWGDGDPSYQVEPSSGKKTVGWQPGEKPPSQYFNWLIDRTGDWQDWTVTKTENIEPCIIRSDDPVTWINPQLTFTSHIEIHWRAGKAGAAQINRINSADSPLSLSDGQVLVVKRDKASNSPVNLSTGTYGSLAAGEYVIVSEASLTLANEEDEMILFRRRGNDLEIPWLGTIIPIGSTFDIGQGGAAKAVNVSIDDAGSYFTGTNVEAALQEIGASVAAGGTIDASQVVSGTFADARIAQSNVTQYQAALTLAASQITSGTFANARIAQSNVTQHQAALSIAETQIPDGSILARVAGNENISGSWTFPTADPPAANQVTKQSTIKAWLYFISANQHGGADTFVGYNISSLGDPDDDGNYIVNWNTDFASSSYGVICMGANGSNIVMGMNATSSASSVTIFNFAGSNQDFNLIAVGAQ